MPSFLFLSQYHIDMNKENKFDKYFMNIAVLTSQNSYAKRSRVGAVMVRDGRIISIGWNGQPKGYDNCCEEVVEDSLGNRSLVTLPTVIHAEVNAIYWCAKTEIISDGATMYITLSPCVHCALAMIQAGIKRVCYLEKYRDTSGIDVLEKAGIKVEKVEL